VIIKVLAKISGEMGERGELGRQGKLGRQGELGELVETFHWNL
jgi:hypothetical protein